MGAGRRAGAAASAFPAGAAVLPARLPPAARRGREPQAHPLYRLVLRLRPRARGAVLDHRAGADGGLDFLVAGTLRRPGALGRGGVLYLHPRLGDPLGKARLRTTAGLRRGLGAFQYRAAILVLGLSLEFLGRGLDHPWTAGRRLHPARGLGKRAWPYPGHGDPGRAADVRQARAGSTCWGTGAVGERRLAAAANPGGAHRAQHRTGAAQLPRTARLLPPGAGSQLAAPAGHEQCRAAGRGERDHLAGSHQPLAAGFWMPGRASSWPP